MNKSELLQRLDKAWVAFRTSYLGLSEPQLSVPGVVGNWSVRDIIAHVTTWEEEALKHLPLIMKDGKPPRYSVTYGGINAFNRLMTGGNRACTSPRCSSNRRESTGAWLTSSKVRPKNCLSAKLDSVIVCAWIPTVTIRSTRRRFGNGARFVTVLARS